MAEGTNTQDKEAHFASAKSINLPISKKQSYEIANFLRGKNLQKAKKHLQQVIDKKMAVPYKRYNRDTGHKPGIASGRYPEKTSKAFLMLLNSVEANAENKGLDNEKLIIKEIRSSQGTHQFHPGRLRGRRMKRTHIYIKVEESIDHFEEKSKEKKVEKKKEITKPEPKEKKKEPSILEEVTESEAKEDKVKIEDSKK